MKITCLGAGDAYSDDIPNRNRSCYLLRDSTLLDCNPEILNALYSTDNSSEDIENVFITHFHADHFFGMVFLINEFISRNPREKELNIIGPEGVRDYIEDLVELGYAKNLDEEKNFDINYIEAEPEEEHDLGSLRFVPYEMRHNSRKITALGYRIEVRGEDKVVSYTGDTGPNESIYKLAEGADVLISDCNFVEKPNNHHMELDDIKKLREELPIPPEIMLTHRGESMEEMESIKGIVLPQDRKVYEI